MLYRAKFERTNWGYSPPLKQHADVVWDSSVPFDNEHIEEFETKMWDAMWSQNPHWLQSQGPLSGDKGWSSVGTVPGSKIEKVERMP